MVAQEIIAARMTALGQAADALLDKQSLSGDELAELLARFPATAIPPELQQYIVSSFPAIGPLDHAFSIDGC